MLIRCACIMIKSVTQGIAAIFLDRDGTINIDYGYVHDVCHFHFLNGVIDACRELIEMGFALVLVTNQSGIGYGKFSEKQFMHLTKWMCRFLADSFVNFDRVYFCPHHPEASIEKYRQECHCRKPHPGMLLQALHEMNIDMGASYMVGDKVEDMQAAMMAGVGTKVLVRTGKQITAQGKVLADWVLNSLVELPEVIRRYI